MVDGPAVDGQEARSFPIVKRPRLGGWIQTFSGRQFWPADPRPEEIHLEDIAHHLSNLCRFTGAVRSFYSVAQHCVLTAWAVSERDRKWALLHDAAEAYVNDLNRPTKHNPGLEGYRHLEQNIMLAVALRLSLSREMPASVREADDRMLVTERRDLLKPVNAPDWMSADKRHVEPYEFTVVSWEPPTARREFLKLADSLGVV